MRFDRTLPVASALALCALVACGSERPEMAASGGKATASGAPSSSGTTPVFQNAPPSAPPKDDGACGKMDIVFVVDDSGSMGEEQQNLATNFALVTSRLDALSGTGGTLDYRIAVTTTSRTFKETPFGIPLPFPAEDGDDGEFRRACGMSRPWIERADGDRATKLSCAAAVGANGSSLEMPLDAMMLSVTDRVADGKNASFLRDDALLAVVIMTDEDDCSHKAVNVSDECNNGDLRPIPTYLATLDQLKKGRERWAAAVIAGETACTSSFGSAAEAARLKSFVQQVGKNAVFSSICQGDLVQPLEAALQTFGEACKGFTVK